MPGSIQVSVLNFKKVPSSSNSVKISLGKVEYEAWENETFDFPLMNMRDKLIITIHDSEGNQVLELCQYLKRVGVWDDVFSIEGSGLIHLKLKFILGDEERNRIRTMRESATKKKQAEILGSRLTNAENAKFLASALNTYQILSDVEKTNEERGSNKNNEFLLQAEAPKKLPEDTKALGFLKNNNAAKPIPLDQQSLEDKNPTLLKKMNKERKFPPFSQKTKVNANKTNEIQLQETSLPKRLKDSSSSDVGSSRLTVAEKVKSFSPKLSDKKVSLEKTPHDIKKMISVFESGLSKDRVSFKPGRKSNRFGSSHLWKDDTVEKPDTHLKDSEVSSSTRLRSSFSTGDLTKNLASVITKDDQVEVDEDFVESAEIVVKGEVIESADKETSNGPFGQAMKIALVIGFGVVAFLFRQRDTGKGNKENTRASRNIVLMNKRGSIEDQRRRIRVSWST